MGIPWDLQGNKDSFLHAGERRGKKCLLSFIKACIKQRTTIKSDKLAAYQNIKNCKDTIIFIKL